MREKPKAVTPTVKQKKLPSPVMASDAELLEQLAADSKLTPEGARQKREELREKRLKMYGLVRARGATERTEFNRNETSYDARISMERIEAGISMVVQLEYRERDRDWRRTAPTEALPSLEPLERTARHHALSLNPAGDPHKEERDQQIDTYRKLLQRSYAIDDASADTKLNYRLGKALYEAAPMADGELVKNRTAWLAQQIVSCRRLESWRLPAALQKFQRHAKEAATLLEKLQRRLAQLRLEMIGSEKALEFSLWASRLSTQGNQHSGLRGLGLKPEEKLRFSLNMVDVELGDLRTLLGVPGISPVQGPPKKHAYHALYLSVAAILHELTRSTPVGITTNPDGTLSLDKRGQFCVDVWECGGWDTRHLPIAIIKGAFETFRDQHLADGMPCQYCAPGDLST